MSAIENPRQGLISALTYTSAPQTQNFIALWLYHGQGKQERDQMITLYRYIPIWGLPDPSPFVVKIQLYLAMINMPYKSVIGSPMTAQKGKLPYIDDDGTIIADSSFIIDHLKRRYGDPLDAHLSPRQRAIGTAFKSLLEEHFYWVLIYLRYQQDESWAIYQEIGQKYAPLIGIPDSQIPSFLDGFRAHIKNELSQQGTGRHSAAEVTALGKQHLTAIVDYLGDNPYFLGEQPSSFDATVYAFLTGILQVPIPSEVKDYGLSLPTLSAYCDRISQRYLSK